VNDVDDNFLTVGCRFGIPARSGPKVPAFEESRQQLISAVSANERAELIQKLVKAANVKR
jgi:hypothetical protein